MENQCGGMMDEFPNRCPECHGTGCVSQARYDPPEECDCWTREVEDHEGELSNCCTAPIVMGDICSDCREHCEPMGDDEEEKA